MNKNVKVVYYVDIDDNTKGCLCAIPSDKDLRDSSVIQKVADEIKNVFEPIHQLMGEHSYDLAKAVCHHGYSNIFEYEFGIEEIPLFGVHKIILQGC